MNCLLYLKLDSTKSDIILKMSSGEDNSDENEDGAGIATITKKKVKKPRKYKVLLHNDDYTTMEFVVYVLKKHFSKNLEEAQQVMLRVHHDGVGICGVYTYEVAESKVAKVSKEAQNEGHPLMCTFEPE